MDERIGRWLAARLDAVRQHPWLTLTLAFVGTCARGLPASREAMASAAIDIPLLVFVPSRRVSDTLAARAPLALSIHPRLASLGMPLTIGVVLILVANLVRILAARNAS